MGVQNGTPTQQESDTEKALATGLKPLKQIEICPALFDGDFGTDPVVPSQRALMEIMEAKLNAGAVPHSPQPRHNEAVVDKHILQARKTTAWMHLRFLELALPDKKAYAFRVVIQIQSPVTHPGDEKQYVFANLYEDSKVVLANHDLVTSAINDAVGELFEHLASRWALAHSPQ
jgi:hypothetical protein